MQAERVDRAKPIHAEQVADHRTGPGRRSSAPPAAESEALHHRDSAGVGHLVDAASAAGRVQRAPVLEGATAPGPQPALPRIQAAPETVIRRKAPSGWDGGDESTMKPDHYGGFSYDLVNDALDTLDLDVQRPIADLWATKALSSGMVGLGPIRSTYKSSYDRDADAFSVSQDVPLIAPLVVHAHISPTDEVAYDGGVNLKWAHDEGGSKAGTIPRSIGEGLIGVDAARLHWEANPDHDRAEEDAEDILVGMAIADLFDETKAAKEEAARRKLEAKDLINWGYKNTKDMPKYQAEVKKAKAAQKAGSEDRMNKLIQIIRDAKTRKESKAKQ